jgi:hypothetical protein
MAAMKLEGRMGKTIDIDLCSACQTFWFDKYESLALSNASSQRLIALIQESAAAAKAGPSHAMRCPRCSVPLVWTHDIQNDEKFCYWRCTKDHGRLIGFIDFLREKNFIHALTPIEINALRQMVQVVNCKNCGAAMDLARDSACRHCGSPISIVDMKPTS